MEQAQKQAVGQCGAGRQASKVVFFHSHFEAAIHLGNLRVQVYQVTNVRSPQHAKLHLFCLETCSPLLNPLPAPAAAASIPSQPFTSKSPRSFPRPRPWETLSNKKVNRGPYRRGGTFYNPLTLCYFLLLWTQLHYFFPLS